MVENRGHEGSNPSTRTIMPPAPHWTGHRTVNPAQRCNRVRFPGAAPFWAWASGWPPALGAGLHRFESCHPDQRGCRPAAGSGAAIAQTRVRIPSASPIQTPPKLMGTSNRPLTGGQRVRGSLEAPTFAGPVVALGLITRRWKHGSTPSPATNLPGFRSRHPVPGNKPHPSPSTLSGIAATLRKWCFCPFDSDLGYQSHGLSGSLQCGALGGS